MFLIGATIFYDTQTKSIFMKLHPDARIGAWKDDMSVSTRTYGNPTKIYYIIYLTCDTDIILINIQYSSLIWIKISKLNIGYVISMRMLLERYFQRTHIHKHHVDKSTYAWKYTLQTHKPTRKQKSNIVKILLCLYSTKLQAYFVEQMK